MQQLNSAKQRSLTAGIFKGLRVYLSIMLDLKMSLLSSSSSSRSCWDFVTLSLLSGKSVLTNTVAGKIFRNHNSGIQRYTHSCELTSRLERINFSQSISDVHACSFRFFYSIYDCLWTFSFILGEGRTYICYTLVMIKHRLQINICSKAFYVGHKVIIYKTAV